MNHFKLTVTLIILWTEKWLFLHENLRPKIFISFKYQKTIFAMKVPP
jgi:hypothetical protein